MTRYFAAIILILCGSGAALAQSPPPAMFGRVAVNQTHIVFSYAGDLWQVPRSGGVPRRLTTHPAEESFPAFSPDGSQLAFSMQLGNNWDIYVMPATGGEPKRLTHHPQSDFTFDWTPDSKAVLFGSSRSGLPRLHTIRVDGVLPVELPLPRAIAGSFSPDGTRIAYTPNQAVGDWRYYRGGGTGQIWLATAGDWSAERLSQGPHSDDFPMWLGDKIYFISDRTGIFNLFSYDVARKQTRQITSFEKYGIRLASAGAGAVVFLRDGRYYLHDSLSGNTRIIDIRVNAEAAELKPRSVNPARTIEFASLDATGDRVFLGARGEALVFEPATGSYRNLTRTPGVAERYPTISPDGKWLAYFSDESGEYELHLRPAQGDGPVMKIAIESKPGFYREPTWSPDSKRIAFAGKRLDLWIADIEAKKATRVDTSTYSYQELWYPAWSRDGRWLAYSKHLHNRVRTIFIYDCAGRRVRQISDGRTHCEQPVFDANGKYLYFASSPNAGTSEFGWGVLNGIFARPLVSRRLHAIVLQQAGLPPVMPNGRPNPDARVNEITATVRIDFEGLERRVVDLPVPARDYGQLAADKPGVLYALVTEWPSPPIQGALTQTLYSIDMNTPAKSAKLVESVGAFELSRDGRRLLYLKARNWYVVGTEVEPKPDDGRLDLSKLEVSVEPHAEWQQMYNEAWRIMRDWFYDPSHHGLNLAELKQHYAEYLPSVIRRADLNALMNRMLGHVSVSHLGVGGGDLPQAASGQMVALLGADFEIAGNRYRIKQIYRAGLFNSVTGSVAAPLDRPGLDVREGEYLIAVDGRQIDSSKDIYAWFEGKGPSPIEITVGPRPDGAEARTVSVYPIANEAGLRSANWAEANRRRVEEASGGKLGYIYVGNYGIPGISDFIRGLVGYSNRGGVIIDERFNGGGITPDYLIEWLLRRPVYYYAFREGDDIATPVNPGPPVKVLIVNEQNFSAAETFAFMYKLAKVGPIVGKRTGGGGIGPYVFTPQLIDGGFVQLPNRAAYDPDGSSWGIENNGVVPDYEVDLRPKDLLSGRDPQLEKAIEVALEEMKKTHAPRRVKPKYPVHP